MGARSRRADEFIAGDPLRAVAALMVVAFHITYVAYLRAGVPQSFFVTYGNALGHLIDAMRASIYVFFALSGFLIARPFAASIVLDAPLPRTGAYLRNRVLRVVPLFWVACTLALLIHGTAGATGGEIAALFGFAQVYVPSVHDLWLGQGWTLDLEIAFYAVLPVAGAAAGWLLRGRLRPGGRAALLLLGLAALGVLTLQAARSMDPRFFPAMLSAFLPGVGLAVLEPVLAPRLRGMRGSRAVSIVLFLAGVAVCLVWERSGARSQALQALLATAAGGALVAAPLVHQWATGRCTRLLDNRPLHWIGERTYSLYLLHLFILYALAHALAPDRGAVEISVLAGIPTMAFSMAAAAVSYRLVERPFLALRRSRRTSPAERAATAYPSALAHATSSAPVAAEPSGASRPT